MDMRIILSTVDFTLPPPLSLRKTRQSHSLPPPTYRTVVHKGIQKKMARGAWVHELHIIVILSFIKMDKPSFPFPGDVSFCGCGSPKSRH